MRPTLPALTSLRFFAALFVVLFHFRLSRTDIPDISIFSFGYQAVTFFFILSGFILTYCHATPAGMNVSPSTFFSARISRIAPAYYLALTLALPMFFAKGPLLCAPLVISMTQAWLPQCALSWSSPAWSLSNEIFFYLCFPAILIATNRISPAKLLATAAALVILMAIFRETGSQEWGPYCPLFNLPQFVLGMALGKYYLAVDRRPSVMLLPIGVGALILMVMFANDAHWLTGTIALSLVFSIIILGSCRDVPMLNIRPLYVLGEASYSIYILHDPLLSYWKHLIRSDHVPAALDLALYLAVMLTASIAAYYFFEKPSRKWIISWQT